MGFLRQLDLLLSPRAVPQRQDVGSDPFLGEVWRSLRREFFPERPELDLYCIVWSARRQKRVLASCNIRRRKVVVARELFEPAAVRWIGPVLYHELCHAVIDEQVSCSRGGRRMWHGREFQELERRHPDIAALHAWISSGGWAMAVRASRTRSFWQARKSRPAPATALALRSR